MSRSDSSGQRGGQRAAQLGARAGPVGRAGGPALRVRARRPRSDETRTEFADVGKLRPGERPREVGPAGGTLPDFPGAGKLRRAWWDQERLSRRRDTSIWRATCSTSNRVRSPARPAQNLPPAGGFRGAAKLQPGERPREVVAPAQQFSVRTEGSPTTTDLSAVLRPLPHSEQAR